MQFGKILKGELHLRNGYEPIESIDHIIFNPKPENWLSNGWKIVNYDDCPDDKFEYERIIEELDDLICIHWGRPIRDYETGEVI